MSTNIVVITNVTNATFNGLPGAVGDLIANHASGAADIQRALVVYEAGLLAHIATQTTVASAATAALNTLQGNVDNLVDAAISAGDDLAALKNIRDTQAAPLSSASRKAAAQAAVDKAAADLAAAQAALATHS